MIWGAYTNYQKVNEWKLKLRTIHVMHVFANLENWATPCKSDNIDDKNMYYLLYREKILSELPFLGSISTISRCIKELEEKDIIKSINKNTAPAYCLTAKGLEWKNKMKSEKMPNVGEMVGSKSKQKNKIERKIHPFSLSKKCMLDECSNEYLEQLQNAAYKKCDEKKIPHVEYNRFVKYYLKVDRQYRNWLLAFSDWCENYLNRIAEIKQKEVSDRGLYQ